MINDTLVIDMELSGDCTAKCPFCPRQYLKRNNKLLTKEKIEIIIRQIEALTNDYARITIYFMGRGEPLHNKEGLFFVLKWLQNITKRNTIETILYTNNSLLDKEFMRNPLLKQLNKIVISVAGYNSKNYEKIYGCSWENTLRNIYYLREKWDPPMSINIASIDYLKKDKDIPMKEDELSVSCNNAQIPYKRIMHCNLGSILYKTQTPNSSEIIQNCDCRVPKYISISCDGLYLFCFADFAQEYALGSVETIPLEQLIKSSDQGFLKQYFLRFCQYCDAPMRPPARQLDKG